MTWWGTIAGILGATIIAAETYAFFDVSPAVVWLAGVLGVTVGSILGATAEGTVGWMNNDAVNVFGTLSGAVLAMVMVVFR
ncbi:MAG: hypothetical protein A2V59_04210 [Armatimonadetes bacterium RBG_19FT_COMBO_69_19]|nr:MAG: hypothetical protein A2V59_04210 [Armatimonadetes bacterium RBG_19FT_COMBO_69_19]